MFDWQELEEAQQEVEEKMSKKLPHNKDNVCMAVNDDTQVRHFNSKVSNPSWW